MANGSQNNVSYQAQKWTNLRTFTIGETGKDVDGTANISWSKDEILGASDSSKFLRGDKTWSDTLIGPLYINYAQDVGKDQNGSLIIGNKAGENIGIDSNEIMARNNSAVSTLYLNDQGGTVQSGGTFYSSASPGFNNTVGAGSWSYLRLHNGSNFWDIATNSSYDGGALEFRINGASTGYYFKTTDIPAGAANMNGAVIANTMTFHRNGILIPNPGTINDGGFLRVKGTGESDTILELGTWDDYGTGETIQFNYYPTNSQITPTYSVTVPKTTGTLNVTGANVSGSSHAAALQAYFNSYKASEPRNILVSHYSSAYGNGSLCLGYFLSGYDSGPYGGFFVAHYNNAYYVGISNGTYTEQHILTSTNYTSYTVTKTGGGASGTWGINVTGNAATATALTSNAGNSNTPVYFSGGKPVATNNKLGAVNANGYWGMRGADNGDSWIRTTSAGIIPVQSGGSTNGHCGLGTSSWYFSYSYIQNMYANILSLGANHYNGPSDYALHLNNSDIVGVNGIFMSDTSDSHGEGINFYRNGSVWDSIAAKSGTFYFASGAGIGTGLTGTGNINCAIVDSSYIYVRAQTSSNEGGEIVLNAAPSYGYYAAMDVYQNEWRIHSNGGVRFWVNIQSGGHADYAEDRLALTHEPGRVYKETNECILVKADARLIPGCSVCSDTFGTCIPGDENGVPFAVSGRALVYPYQSRENYQAGMAVCSAPNGTVDIMTREEIREYPDCIIGYVAGISSPDTWPEDNVPLNGRIWIRLA